MSGIKVTKTEPILSDERGHFFEVTNSIIIRHIVITTFTKGAVRGNQFRKNMDQYFFLVSGKAKLVTKSIKNGECQETQMSQGSFVYIPRNVAFTTIAEEESVLLEFSPQHYDPNNPDINRIQLV